MATINIRVDDTLKQQAFGVIERFGMTPSQAFKMFLTQIAQTGTIPLSLDYQALDYQVADNHKSNQAIAYESNPISRQAIAEFRAGKVTNVLTVDELMDELMDKSTPTSPTPLA